MDISMLINGTAGDQVSIHDRGLLYGDGVFRTMRMLGGQVLDWPRHYRKLQHDCAALAIACPESALLSDELLLLSNQQPDGIAKIIVTRGFQGMRGYAPTAKSLPTRILSVSPAPGYPPSFSSHGIKLRVCDMRLGHQPRLAGIKHLNRLENVLAAAESSAPEFAEGVLLDIAENVIEGIRSNLFIIHGGKLITADLSLCGVAGVQRERVLEWAAQHGVPFQVRQFPLEQLLNADEIFLVNSVIGLWPVRELQNRSWNQFPVSMQIQKWLNNAKD